jgi:hypothetical protein
LRETDPFHPRPKHKFSFGFWTVGNRGRDPFGDFVRPAVPPVEIVKFLEDVGYAGRRHFDAHAYRTEDDQGVKDFAAGCMRTYQVLRDKAVRWNADNENSSFASGTLEERLLFAQDFLVFKRIGEGTPRTFL